MARTKVPKWCMRSWGFIPMGKKDMYTAPRKLQCKHCKTLGVECVTRRFTFASEDKDDFSEFNRWRCCQCDSDDEWCSKAKTVHDPHVASLYDEYIGRKERIDTYTNETRKKNELEARLERKRKAKEGKNSANGDDKSGEDVVAPLKKRLKTGVNTKAVPLTSATPATFTSAQVETLNSTLAAVKSTNARIDTLHDAVELLMDRVDTMASAQHQKDLDDAYIFSKAVDQNEELVQRITALQDKTHKVVGPLGTNIQVLEKVILKLSGAMDKLPASIGSLNNVTENLQANLEDLERLVHRLSGATSKVVAPDSRATKRPIPRNASPGPSTSKINSFAATRVRFDMPGGDEPAPFKFGFVNSDDELPEVYPIKPVATPRAQKKTLGSKDAYTVHLLSSDSEFSSSDSSSSDSSSSDSESPKASKSSDWSDSEFTNSSREGSSSLDSDSENHIPQADDMSEDDMMDTDGPQKMPATKEQLAEIATKSSVPINSTPLPKPNALSQFKAKTKSNYSPIVSSPEEDELNNPKPAQSTLEEEMINSPKRGSRWSKKACDASYADGKAYEADEMNVDADNEKKAPGNDEKKADDDNNIEEDELDPEEHQAAGEEGIVKIFL